MQGWICLSVVFLAPVVTFVIGYQLGKNGLPYRIVKVGDDTEQTTYAVED